MMKDIVAGWWEWMVGMSWQVVILVVVIGAICFFLQRARARVLYFLWLLVLVKLVIPPGVGHSYSVGSVFARLGAVRSQEKAVSSAPQKRAVEAVNPAAITTEPSVETEEARAPSPAAPPIDVGLGVPESNVDSSAERSLEAAATGDTARRLKATATSGILRSLKAVATKDVLFVIWVIGVGAMFFRTGFSLMRFRRWLRARGEQAPDWFEQELEALRKEVGIRRAPRCVIIPDEDSPCLFGWFQPTLLFPKDLLERLTREQLRMAIYHELFHIKRRDTIMNGVQSVLQVLYWFHPAVWLAGREIRNHREMAVDEAVTSTRGDLSAGSYEQTILALSEHASRRAMPAMVGMVEPRSLMFRRVVRLLSGSLSTTNRRVPILSWVMVAVFALFFIPMGMSQPKGGTQEAGAMTVSQTVGVAVPANTVKLSYVDDTAESKHSLGASGHAVSFERPADARFVEAVQIAASRYGEAEPPKEDFHLYLLNEKFQVLADIRYPYSMVERTEDLRWYTLRTPSVEVPEKFYVALAFNPSQTKGIYVGIDKNVSETHSYTGLPDSGYEKVKETYDWMVRVYLSKEPTGEKGVQRLADWKAPQVVDPFEGCVEIAYDTGKSEGMQSYGGRGPAIRIEMSDLQSKGLDFQSAALKGIRLYAGRYGSGYEPDKTMVKVYIMDGEGKIYREENFPYALFSYTTKWVDLVLAQPFSLKDIPETKAPLTIGLDPEATQYKGIYFHYNKDPKVSHSLVGNAKAGYKPIAEREWMIRSYFAAPGKSSGDPAPAAEAPEEAQDLLNKAEGLYKEKKLAEAIEVYKEIYEKYPKWNYAAHAAMMIGICYDNMGEKEKALEAFEKAAQAYPDMKGFSEVTYFYLGEAYALAGRREKALETFKKSWELCQGIRKPDEFPCKEAADWIVKLEGEKVRSGAPQIVQTTPAVGAKDVDPGLKEIVVVFDQDMGGGFSWTGGGEVYPKTTEKPFWRDSRTCVLPVSLEAGKFYRVGINSKSHQNFRSKGGMPVNPTTIYFTTAGAPGSVQAALAAPKIIAMTPLNGAKDVSPATGELRVTFDQEMGGGFSWTGGGENYPEVAAKPYWTEDKKTAVLPVKLKPNWSYRLGLNSVSHINFQSAKGVPLEPVAYTFGTGEK